MIPVTCVDACHHLTFRDSGIAFGVEPKRVRDALKVRESRMYRAVSIPSPGQALLSQPVHRPRNVELGLLRGIS